jgi:hypothetical protein
VIKLGSSQLPRVALSSSVGETGHLTLQRHSVGSPVSALDAPGAQSDRLLPLAAPTRCRPLRSHLNTVVRSPSLVRFSRTPIVPARRWTHG